MSITGQILVLSSPPGGTLDPNGAFANSIDMNATAVTANSTTAPFASAVSSGAVQLRTFGDLATMSWKGITPAATTGGSAATWTYAGFVPQVYRPAATQVATVLIENAGTFASGTCQVDTAGNVTFSPVTTAAPGGNWTGNSASLTGFYGFTMAWSTV